MLEKRGRGVKLNGTGASEDCCCKAIMLEGTRYGICEIVVRLPYFGRV